MQCMHWEQQRQSYMARDRQNARIRNKGIYAHIALLGEALQESVAISCLQGHVK
jgi:hypothetical protein